MTSNPAIKSTNRLEGMLRRVQDSQVVRKHGRVVQLIGLVIESEGPLAAVGEVCRIESARHDGSTLAEVVGFRNNHVLLMPLGEVQGIHPGSEVIALGTSLRVPVGDALMGRVIDGLGTPLDEHGAIESDVSLNLRLAPPHPLKRSASTRFFRTGIKAIDTFTPCGRGQRLGIFAGSGVGKSTLLGMIASQAESDVM